MFSYQAFLEIRNCGSEDAGLYKVIVRNKVGEISAGASLLVAEQKTSHFSEANPVLAKVKSVEEPSLKTNSNVETSFGKQLDSSRHLCIGQIATPCQPYTPRKFYEKRFYCSSKNKELAEAEREQSKGGAVSPVNVSLKTAILNKESVSKSEATLPQENASKSIGSNSDQCLETNIFCITNNEAFSTVREETKIENSFDLNGSSKKRISRQAALKEKNPSEKVVQLQSHHLFERTDTEQSSPIAAKRIPPKVILTTPREISIKADEKLILSCRVEGLPKPKIVWMKDAHVISRVVAYEFLEENGKLNNIFVTIASLKLESIDISHQGKYTISAFNVCGDSSAEFNVAVISNTGRLKIMRKKVACMLLPCFFCKMILSHFNCLLACIAYPSSKPNRFLFWFQKVIFLFMIFLAFLALKP